MPRHIRRDGVPGRPAGAMLLALGALLLAGCAQRMEPAVSSSAAGAGGQDATAPGAAPAHWPAAFGFGRAATPEEVAAWDLDVGPDGAGLPPGSGTVAQGRQVYALKCASCHGPTGTEGPSDRLVGTDAGEDFAFGREFGLTRTIGNYWPYATTLYDYILRAMPQTTPGTLTAEEVYGLVAFLLHRNEVIDEGAVMNAETLPRIVMPARDRFVPDDRRGGAEVR